MKSRYRVQSKKVFSQPVDEFGRAVLPDIDSVAWRLKLAFSPKGCVYFILAGDSGRVKIGYCQLGGHEERRANMQVGCPDTLRVLAVIEGKTQRDERLLHKKFKRLHIRGEWFRFTQEILDYMKENARRVK